MGSPAVPARTLTTLRVLQASCGLLAAASLVALGQPTPVITAHDGAANVASAQPAVPTEWSGGGPLAIPTIGVVPPGAEDWFDPTAAPVLRAPRGPVPTDPVRLPSTSPPDTDTDPPPTPDSDALLFPSPTASSAVPASPSAAGTETPATETTTPTATAPTTAAATTTPTVTPQTTTPTAMAHTTTAPTTPATPTAPTTSATTTAPTTPTATMTTPTSTLPTTTAPPTTLPTTTPSTTAPTTTATPATTATTATTTPTTTEPVPPTEEPPPPPPEPTTNERGNVALALGEELTVFDGATGAASFAIAADNISPDVPCTDPASTPAVNGRLIAVLVHVTTGPDLAAVGGAPAVSSADFRFLAPDGVTLVEAGTPGAAACLPDTEEFPAGPIAPGQDVTGTVVLDVPATAGTLLFAPDFLPVGAEWEYGPPAG